LSQGRHIKIGTDSGSLVPVIFILVIITVVVIFILGIPVVVIFVLTRTPSPLHATIIAELKFAPEDYVIIKLL
jgi:hypothetical protein